MTDSTIIILGLDDDSEDLLLIRESFDKAEIKNYFLYSNENEFLSSLTKDVRIVVIDHYIRGEGLGPEIMKKVIDSDKALGKLIPTKIIIISGQKRPELMIYYSNAGADYIDKNDSGFYDVLIHFVKKNHEDVAFRLDMAYRQLERMKSTYELLKPPTDEYRSLENNR